jgi:membrane protein implicated in regulation of membrane protease activity
MAGVSQGFAAITSSMVNPVGRSFVLGLPDRLGNYCVGIAGMVWKIPSGAYKPGDRVRVVNAAQDHLEVERVIN